LIDQTPEWAKPENIRDAEGKKPTDVGYDPTTLFIPPNGLKNETPARQ